jgi:hypothetical protein
MRVATQDFSVEKNNYASRTPAAAILHFYSD